MDPEVDGAERLLDAIGSHGIFKLDPTGAIVTWPDSAETLYGHPRATVLDRPLSVLFADEEGSSPILGELLAEATAGPTELEQWHERADGTVFWATVTLSPVWDDRLAGYAVVSQDTTRRKQRTQTLERQNDRLKEFTDILAHDLRTPLNVIDLRLDLLRGSGDAEHIDSIEETTARMERLVDDLLRVARQGDVVSDPVRVELGRVVEAAWEGTGDPASGCTLDYETVPPLSGDADRLQELFENLFQNSIDHGEAGVTVHVAPLEDGFVVEDDGPGIPDSLQDQVFDHGMTTSDSGSGYGLSIVRTIVNAHGWDVVATAGPTGGARFEITGVDFLD